MAKVDPDIQRAVDEYNSAYQDICSSGESLYNTRVKAAKTINDVEDLVNSIANHPKTFDTDIGEIKTNRLKFADAQRIAQEEFDNAKKGATGAIAGVGAGAAIAAAAPSAAMWFATTFGTASTGTAISALSGAAATNAALAGRRCNWCWQRHGWRQCAAFLPRRPCWLDHWRCNASHNGGRDAQEKEEIGGKEAERVEKDQRGNDVC